MEKRIEMPTYKKDWQTTTKVKDLIKALKKCNPEAYVITEGCDCCGPAVAIDISDKDSIEILRD